jgi:hypothetical protein
VLPFLLDLTLRARPKNLKEEKERLAQNQMQDDEFKYRAAVIKHFHKEQLIYARHAFPVEANLLIMSNLPKVVPDKTKLLKKRKIRRGISIAGAYRNPPMEPLHELEVINRLSDLNRTKSHVF